MTAARSGLALALALACRGAVPDEDPDRDGLPTADEVARGTDPTRADSDGDGKDDGFEVRQGLDPLNPDTDGDGLFDGAELATGHDPRVPDRGEVVTDHEIATCAPAALRRDHQAAPPTACLCAGAGADPTGKSNHALQTRCWVALPGPVWIQRTEVSAGELQACLDAGACPAAAVDRSGPSTLVDPNDAPRAANLVSWAGADAYCRWVGGRLPTEAEWLLAAGAGDGRTWPWGEVAHCGVYLKAQRSPPEPARSCVLDRPPHPADQRGESPAGVLGLGGGVWEWLADDLPDGVTRLQRGGGWLSETPADLSLATARSPVPATVRLPDVGFRCAWVPRP